MNISGIGGFASGTAALGMGRSQGSPPTEEEMQANISDFLTSLDSDGNGSVSLEESGVSQASFSEIDSDGDGEITSEELMTFLEAHRPPPPPSSMDSSAASDSASAGEAVASGGGSSGVEESDDSDSDYSVMDTNQDGVVSLEELLAYLQSHLLSAAQQGTETSDDSSGGIMTSSRQQAIQAYSGQQNELLTSLFDYMQNGSQSGGLDITV